MGKFKRFLGISMLASCFYGCAMSIPNRFPDFNGYEYAVFCDGERISDWHVDEMAVWNIRAVLSLQDRRTYTVGQREITPGE